ncbi:MAG: DNA damage-inducible protein D [Bacteroidetes bacterium]|jgi:DNA-damage-inducible protein D|nr:DNA damage-inducible protein D [Bacteroidota bacterium]MBT6687517.1 DNA damage-inducible protein D [Bacteroidota bacterium]MBT7143327.1 DNA damage-inducible protein D [Bacteroidota bacterium]MBT7491543.1 DNA damage-inducible protein D [Bacteroidota bacterium]
MKKEIIQSLTKNFEEHSYTTEEGIEFWFARDLQHLLGYAKWENFNKVITKAKIACEVSGNDISNHFPDIRKTIEMPKGASKEIDDFMLTRYACYLITQNGDPRKESIAFAQNYFAIQTRKYELIEQRIKDWERLQARQKLTYSEKELSELIFEQTGNDRNFGIIRSKGDQALFGGNNTKQMKTKLGIPQNRPLADFLPTITIKAKDFATEITVFNTKEKSFKSERQISAEHITNNRSVRKILLERGIKPEELPAEEDIKKLERRVKSDDKKLGKNPDKLDK